MNPVETPANVPAGRAQLREALRGAASALKEHGPRFALASSYALWAYGAPEPGHDVDLVVTEADAAVAVTTLWDAGFAVEHPPQDWLFKACSGNTVVDVLHRLNGVPVELATLDCAEQCVPPTMAHPELCSLGEHQCDFAKLLPAVRAIRELLDWDRIRAQTADNDHAVAFLVLTDRLGLTN